MPYLKMVCGASTASWIIWHKARSNQIIETTVPRILYFGFVMTTEMCEEFADNNY